MGGKRVPYLRELHDVVHEGDDGGPLSSRMLIDKPTGAILSYDELQGRRGPQSGPASTLHLVLLLHMALVAVNTWDGGRAGQMVQLLSSSI